MVGYQFKHRCGLAAKAWYYVAPFGKEQFKTGLELPICFHPSILNQLGILTNSLTHKNFQFIKDCVDYLTAIETLPKLFVELTNAVHAWHMLSARLQLATETFDEYLIFSKL